MTLVEALKALKDAGVMSGALKTEGLELSVQFWAEIPKADPAPGDAPSPGGWKTPQNLDEPFEDDPLSEFRK